MAATKKKHKTSFLISILARSRFPHSFLTTQLLPDSIWTTRKADTVAELDQRLTENTLQRSLAETDLQDFIAVQA